MSGSFPTSVTTYTNPAPGDVTSTELGTRDHQELHADANDDLEAVMTKLGTGASTPSAGTVLRGTGTGSTAYGAIVSGDITDDTIVNSDINSAAAIAVTKLAHVGAGNVLRSNGSTNVGGQIVSGDIADGTIATADLLAGAISQGASVAGSTSSPTTASGTAADLQEMTLTPTLIGGGLLLVLFETEWTNSAANAATIFDLLIGGSAVLSRQPTIRTANEENIMTVVRLQASVAGATTIKVQWRVTGGTATAAGVRRSLSYVELKK